VGKPEEKRSLARPKHRWEVGIRLDLRETGWKDVEWVQLVQDTNQWWVLVNTVMNFWVLVPWSYLISNFQDVGLGHMAKRR
jgi:hypothetical protein